MRLNQFITLLACLVIWVFPCLAASAQKSAVSQREDSSVILPVEQAKKEGNSLVWKFDLQQPGIYVVQLVVETERSSISPRGTVEIDGTAVAGALENAYVIEDGVVSNFEQTADLARAGEHTLTLRSQMAVSKVRLIPQGYVNSRITISSDKYYDAWLKMHQSPAKVAAMEWYKKARFGMFIHWGVYSEAAGSWKGVPIEKGDGPKVAEWLMFAFKISRAEYREYAKNFNPDKSFAANIAQLAKQTGMKYVVITAKHHDGFALFDSAHSDFDIAQASPYEGDLIKELYEACRAEGLEFGVYYSHGHDWTEGTDANYANVKAYNDSLGVFTRPNGKNLWDPSPNPYDEYLENKAYPQVAELVRMLPDLRLIWFDGEGLMTEAQALRFYKMVYDLNPNIIINRRVGYDFGDYVDAGDNKTPAANELAAKHFETCGTGNHSWGYKAHDHKWKSPQALLRNFVDIVSKGGNYLLNIGPDGRGQVPEQCIENFEIMGEWVHTNAEAVFGTSRWSIFHEGEAGGSEFWFSARDNNVYAMSLAQPAGRVQIRSLGNSVGTVKQVRLLGGKKRLKWTQDAESLEIDFTGVKTGENGYAVEVTLKP